MNRRLTYTSTLKASKPTLILLDLHPSQPQLNVKRTKINPIRIVRKNPLNNSRKIARLALEGIKHFSSLSAAGLKTSKILKHIQKSPVKFMRKFEFDPYLCDHSYIKDLSQTFRKLRNMVEFNLVIKRADTKNETDRIAPFLYHLMRMKKLRYEISYVPNMDDEGYINLVRSFSKCYSVKRIEVSSVDVQHVSERAFWSCPRMGRKRILLEEIKVTTQRNGNCHQEGCKALYPSEVKKFRQTKLKKFSLYFGLKTGWLSIGPDQDQSPLFFLRIFTSAPNLSDVTLRFSGTPLTFETFQVLCITFPKATALRKLHLEFLNSQVSEAEMVLFGQALPQFSHIEEFTFKVIQHPHLFEDCIYYFSKVVSKQENLKKWQLYFRRLSIEPETLDSLVKRINMLNDTKCDSFKQSLHIYKHKKDEII